MKSEAVRADDAFSTAESRSFIDIFEEGLRYFMGEGELNNALSRLVADLKEHEIDYVVIGAVALMAHGYPRFTENLGFCQI